jgi:sulfite exporter TauE/SafE
LTSSGTTRTEEVNATLHHREQIYAILGLVTGFLGFTIGKYRLLAAILFAVACLLMIIAAILAFPSTVFSHLISSTVNFTLPGVR